MHQRGSTTDYGAKRFHLLQNYRSTKAIIAASETVLGELHDRMKAGHRLKIAKAMSKSPRVCIALVSSMASCKSALSAGMRCVALPDAFTSFQDFGGADVVYEHGDEVAIEELLKTMLLEEE